MNRFQQSKEEDRLSAPTDDVLLYILARVDLSTAARTSALSTRWRQLPELTINVKDFLPVPHPDPIAENDMFGAMVSLTEAARSLFARPQRGSILSTWWPLTLSATMAEAEADALDDMARLVSLPAQLAQ